MYKTHKKPNQEIRFCMLSMDKSPCVSKSLKTEMLKTVFVDKMPFPSLNEEYSPVRLEDLSILTTLGVGGFGRVELVQIKGQSNKSYALKQMKKSQIVETRQQQHIMSEKEIMGEANCDFIVKLYKTFKVRI